MLAGKLRLDLLADPRGVYDQATDEVKTLG
jgi:hypothetical protein